MQKKINLLATLLVIAIVLGGLSTCSDASFQEGFRVGAEEETVKFEPGFGSDEDAGENPEEAYIARLRLLPRHDYRAFPFSFRNTLTGAEVPMAPEAVKLAIPKEDLEDIVWLPDAQGTQVFVNGESVEFERSEDGKVLTATVPEETPAEEVPVKVNGVDVSRGFSRKVEGTVFTATLLPPYEVEKSEDVADEPWSDNGDGNVTINVEVVPGLYYAAASATTLEGLSCPGADTPATGDTKLVVEKPASDAQGFYQVWVGDAPIKAD